ncbi:heme exporter protein CcmB [Castellaniella sp. S9]|uniref:heme exporter protein CcmB n=1 Tax=Castellaniella sp. S9 TaxID=2993652 RepID=UPI0022B5196A|nr:heme exporter protein CcmB [Castellaniella sp. S9]
MSHTELRTMRCVLTRDLRLAWRRRTDSIGALVFFIMVTGLFPLGMNPDPTVLRDIAPGVIWVAALLATLLTLPKLFAEDHADGTLEQFLLAGTPLPLLLLSKTAAHWLGTAVPLIVIAPLMALQFNLPAEATGTLFLVLLLGTPTLSLLGAVGAALTVGVRGAATLLAILILPLYIPILVFGAAAVGDSLRGMPADGYYATLGAMLVLALFLAPWASAAALRIALD